MAAIVLVAHLQRPQATELAVEAARWLSERGHEVRVLDEEAKGTELAPWSTDAARLLDGLDLAVSLGGDGTMLRTVDLVTASGVPVLGVNLGNLAYLSEVEPGGLRDALERFLAGEHEIEQRMTLDVEGPWGRGSGLNEVVLEKTVSGHTVRVAVRLNGRPFTTYAADGMIVATPTGSTAYSLSARGPVVSPALRALLVTPVSPHMLFDRTLVLDAGDTVELEVVGERPAEVAIDGRSVGPSVEPGDVITCRAGAHDAQLVSFGRRDFHEILRSKFGLADR